MDSIIRFEDVSYTYQANTPFANKALNSISLNIQEGDFVAVVGHTGSGKSTLMQQINGLLLPSTGKIIIDGQEITPTTKAKELSQIRRKVGLIFQFAEAQLFAETVLEDVAFGPLNFGVAKEEAYQQAEQMLQQVRISKELFNRSPFELSGGQMRRVAIAGILVLQPKILLLDEPTIGLDPKGRLEMMELFKKLQKEHNLTIILVTHSMDDVMNYADQVVVLEKGHLLKHTTPQKLFSEAAWLEEHSLALPKITQFTELLANKEIIANQPRTITKLTELIMKYYGGSYE